MPAIDRFDILYYRDTLERYGYPQDDFGLALSVGEPNEEASLGSPGHHLGPALSTDSCIRVTCYSTHVRRLYAVDGGNTWLMNFEQDLGRGLYRGATASAAPCYAEGSNRDKSRS